MNGKINGKPITVDGENTILDILGKNGVTIDAPCGGRAVCGKCKVKISGNVTPMTKAEKQHLTKKEIDDGIRLACFCKPTGDFEVFTGESKFLIETDAEKVEHEICPDEYVSTFAKSHGKAYGIAIDIGTTTVVSVFFDLITGEKLYTTSDINAQKTYGADVMSRISFASENENGDKILQDAIINQINGMISSSNIPTDDIALIVIDGNTTMQLTASRLSIKSLGAVPFEPLSYFGTEYKAEELGYISKNANIYFMPCAGGFFGGDACSCMLYAGYDKGGLKYVSDIGTNGEMSLVCDGKIYGCSTAAGPAFEGASIRFGTGSILGAINKVEENDDGFAVKTIGDKSPAGLCGSGLIDLIAVCLKKELIDESGVIDDNCPEFEDEPAIEVTDGIYLTQKDIREIQLAKSAICAGTIVLDNKISDGRVPEVFIAGGFGTAINLENSGYIGLLPKKYCDNAKAVGNAALEGAIMALLSVNARKTVEELCKKTEILDLSTDPVFMDEYVENMIFDI